MVRENWENTGYKGMEVQQYKQMIIERLNKVRQIARENLEITQQPQKIVMTRRQQKGASK